MNIKDEYIDKTKDYISDLRKKIDKKAMLKDEIKILKYDIQTLKNEIKILKLRQKVNNGINFENELGIRSNAGVKGIDDLIITTEAQICCKEALIENKETKIENKGNEIERIKQDIRMFELYTRELNDIEKEIIKARYFNKSKNSFRDISKKVNYAKSYVARIHDSAIKELAYFIFGEDAIYL